MISRIVTSLGSFLIALFIGELFLQFFFPIADPYEGLKKVKNGYINSQFPPNVRFQIYAEEGLPGFEDYPRPSTFSTNNWGFRSDDLLDKATDETRIFCIGGSTTECLLLNDGDDWPALLEKKLNKTASEQNYRVINAGKSGDDVSDHLAMLAHRIVHLEPDMVLLFLGINDLVHYCGNQESHFDEPIGKYHSLKLLLSNTQLYRRLYYLFRTLDMSAIYSRTSYKAKAAYSQSLPVHQEPLALDLSAFENNLKSIIGITKANNIELVLMTQQYTWDSEDPALPNWHWINQVCGKRYDQASLVAALEVINQKTVELGTQHEAAIFRTDSLLPKNSTYFYDDCHFNFNGSQTMSEHLHAFLTASYLTPN